MEKSAISFLDRYGLVDNRVREVGGKKKGIRLLDILKEVLTSGDYNKVDVAVGFLFISGMREIEDELEKFFSNGGKMRIVIGNQTNRETYEQLSMAYHSLETLRKLKEKAESEKADLDNQSRDIEANANYMEQTLENEKFLQKLLEWLKENKLEIRVYVKEFMHAKAYLFYPSRGSVTRIGLVGSSNFTLAGFSGNTELNALVQSTHFESLREWYEEIWEEAVPFNPKLLEVIERSWANQVPGKLPSPYEVLIRGLYELYKESLEKGPGSPLKRLEDILYDFQLDAVRRAISIINKYNGVLISDVVGLGKSYIGVVLLDYFSRKMDEDKPWEVAVIAPPELVRYWKSLLNEFRVPGRVFSAGLLPRRDRSPENYNEMKEYIKNRVGIVLVDEAHHYANTNTKSYKNLQELLVGKKVILLTATPYRKQYRDIINQIRLFLPETRHPFPITPQTWDELVKAIEKGEIDPSYVLREIMIRRTRYDILRLYGGKGNCIEIKGGKELLCFPRRKLSVLTYKISEVYPIEFVHKDLVSTIAFDSPIQPEDIYTLFLAGISSMKYARFALYDYVIPHYKEAEPYRSLSSVGRNLRGLMRILYLKRLESSWYAMYQTLWRDIIKTKNFIKFVEHKFIPAGDEFDEVLLGKINGNRIPKVLSDEEVEKFIQEYTASKTPAYKAGAFKRNELLDDLRYDLEKLEAMEEALRPLKDYLERNPSKDPKLQTLAEEIQKLWKDGKKILVFSEFEETVQWIYKGLQKIIKDEELKRKMAYVSSNTKGIADKIRRFAPKANRYEEYLDKDDELDILISTDILSEGLNLQDANVVVNYDLHWTPIKLIQRIGRVDRIGTEHDEILVYNFFPETKLEENLGLVEKVRRRIAEFNNALGADGKILEESEEWNPSAIEAIYKTSNIDEIELEADKSVLSVTTFAEKLVREYMESHKERFDELKKRYSMRSIALSDSTEPYAFFVLSNGVISQYLIYQLVNGEWKKQNIPIEQLIGKTGLSEETPPYNNKKAMDLYREVAKIALGDFKRLLKISGSALKYSRRRYSRYPPKIKLILRRLQSRLERTKDPSEKEEVSKLLDLTQWAYLNHEAFKNALLKKKIHSGTSTDDIIEICRDLIDSFGIEDRLKSLQEEAKKREFKGVKPHIVAGLLFMPRKKGTA